MAYTQKTTDCLIRVNTSINDSGGTLSPTSTTLAAAITVTTSPLAITLAAAASINGTYLNIIDGTNGNETVKIQSGGGTTTPTVVRAQLGTTSVTHANGLTVTIPAYRLVNLLPASVVPNQTIEIQKVSPAPTASPYSDINYVQVAASAAGAEGQDYFPGGATSLLLIDSGVNSTTQIKFPASGNVLTVTGGVGSAAAGQVGPTGPAGSPVSTAPAIAAATCSASYLVSGFSNFVQFSGTITLPTGSPYFSNLAKIVVIGTDPNGNQFPIATVSSPWSGGSVNYNNANGAQIIQPSSTQVWTISFWAYDPNNLVNTTPYTTTVNVNAAGLTSMTFAEVGPRTNVNGSVESTFSLAVTVTGSQLPIWITAAVDYNDGNGPQFISGNTVSGLGQGIGQFYLTSGAGGTTITWNHWVPTNSSQTSWTAYAVVGNMSQNLAIPGGWPSGYITQTLSPTAVGAPLATDVTNAQFIPTVGGADLLYLTNSVGSPCWYYNEIDWTQPTTAYDINYWFSMITVQKGFAQTYSAGAVTGLNTLTDTTNSPFLQFAPDGLSLSIVSGGTGYAVGDLAWLVGGTYGTKACYTVTAVSGGVVTKLARQYPGTYTVVPTSTISTTTSGSGSGLTISVTLWGNQVGYDIHIGGVLTTITGYTSSSVVTFAPQSGIANGSGQTYEVWNWSPDQEGANGPGLGTPYYLGRQIDDSGALSPTGNSIPGSTVQLFGEAADAWNMPAVHNADGSNYLYTTFRFRIYAGSYLMFNLLGGTLVLQTSCWSQSSTTLDHIDITPTSASSPLDLSQFNPRTTNGQFALNGSGQFAVAAGAISAAYTNLAAINASSGALAANAVVSGLLTGTGSPYTLNAGINVFTGAVYLSQGHSNPVVALLNTGIFLYGVAQASGDPTGLQSQPYVAIQSTGILVAQNSTGACVYIDGTHSTAYFYSSFSNTTSSPYVAVNSSGITVANSLTGASVSISSGTVTLYTINGSTADPYITMTSSGIVLASSFGAGNYFRTTISSSGIALSYNGTNLINLSGSTGAITACSLVLNDAGVTTSIANNSFGAGVAGFQCTANAGGQYSVATPNFIGLVNGSSVELVAIVATSTVGTVDLSTSSLTNAVVLSATGAGSSGGFLGLNATSGGSINFDVSVAYTSTFASAGSATLPPNPVKFLIVSIDGLNQKIPYYD